MNLLLGAGFSRNWGGWLANEAFEYLIGCPSIKSNDKLKRLMWEYRRKGFEEILSELQDSGSPNSIIMLDALREMFNLMNDSFGEGEILFEPYGDSIPTIVNFISQFEVIYTLNQDLLLEKRYCKFKRDSSRGGPAGLVCIPGMMAKEHDADHNPNYAGKWKPSGGDFQLGVGCQSLVKLHGSSNFFEEHEELMILGSSKKKMINKSPILSKYIDFFSESLSKDNSKFVIIGYSFKDSHINDVIFNSCIIHNPEFFIIDPHGLDLLEDNGFNNTSIDTSSNKQIILSKFVGGSRRTLKEIFIHPGDRIEYRKIQRFIDN
jgi:hypothetical protein